MSYQEVIEAAIKKEKDILGQRAIEIAQDVDGLTVTDDGSVTDLSGDGKSIMEDLLEEYKDLGGAVTVTMIGRAISGKTDDIDLPGELKDQV